MSRTFTLLLAENPTGANPLTGLYLALTREHPALGLTLENSRILSVQPAATAPRPWRTRLLIEKDRNPELRYEFFYDRFSLTELLAPWVPSPADIIAMQNKTTSKDLIDWINVKRGLNMTAADVWLSINSIEYAGGTVTPNFWIRRVDSSIWFAYGKFLPLH
jgi:hypothetical protein